MQFGGLDIVLSRWRSDLTLSHTVQWGTEDRDEPRAMARDAQGNTYVTGWTYGAFQGANAGDTDVFLTKLNADDEIVWTLQWGGPGTDGGHGLAVDQDGNVYVVGTTGAENGARDAFCRKIDGEGSEVWTATWGGPNSDTATGVGLLSDGSLVVVGRTGGALGGSGSGAAFLARVDSAGNVSDLEQFGATRLDRANRVVVGQGDTYYIVGETEGEMVPGAHAGATDVFIQKRNADGSVQFTHQFGTPAAERADDAALAADGTLCIGGFTLGSFPGYSNAGSWDGYLARFAE